LVDTLPAGRRLVLVEPIIYSLDRWSAPWTALVRMRSAQWRDYALADPALAAVATVPASSEPQRPNPVRATVFVKRRIR
jgi:mannosyltransferase